MKEIVFDRIFLINGIIGKATYVMSLPKKEIG